MPAGTPTTVPVRRGDLGWLLTDAIRGCVGGHVARDRETRARLRRYWPRLTARARRRARVIIRFGLEAVTPANRFAADEAPAWRALLVALEGRGRR